ncbi:hypothetical protein ABW20_dc0110166 [Dactylellina cionopaga]|nr:hypothetical protein ABW20_dc0110166 [Dactylellina cionopaga]
MSAPSSKPRNQPPTAPNLPVNTNDGVANSVPTVDININSSIKSKVKQCLAILQPTGGTNSSNATTTKPAEKAVKRSKLIALRAVYPSAGSKTITVAEIVKRYIAEGDGAQGGKGKGIWWQYTKIESKLIEWPPKQKKQGGKQNEGGKNEDKNEVDEAEAISNANKRKQNGVDERATKKPKLDHPPRNTDSQNDDHGAREILQQPITISSSSTPKANRKKRMDQLDGSYDDMEEIPRHIREQSDPPDSDDDEIPPHLRAGSEDEMDTDDKPPHLKSLSPARTRKQVRPQTASSVSDGRPAHLRESSPNLWSDDRPAFLRDSTPIQSEARDNGPSKLEETSSDDRPPHLQSSTPNTPAKTQPSARQPNSSKSSGPTAVGRPSNKPQDCPSLTSSPPPTHDSNVESENAFIKPQKDLSDLEEDDEEEEDEYRRFTYLDIEQLPEKHTKKLLADLDEAERNRKKYRAIAIMTIYLSLEKRVDLEKLYGVQTNAGEKK